MMQNTIFKLSLISFCYLENIPMNAHLPSHKPILLAVAALALLGGPARADLILTPEAAKEGFKLSTFATGFPNVFNIGPLGIAFPSSGGVLVTDYPGHVRLFSTDADGQGAKNASLIRTTGFDNAIGMAKTPDGKIYLVQRASQRIQQVSDRGQAIRNLPINIPFLTGMAANPSNGHLFVSTFEILDINPADGTFHVFKGTGADGLSTDGTTLYAVLGFSHIVGFRISDGKKVFDSGYIAGRPDGTALGTGSLAGNIFANTNGGRVVEINLATLEQTLIATGGSRGDFVSVDPNGTLLLTQTDRIERLTAPQGSGFGAVPEPGTLMLAGMGLASLLAYGWRRRNRRLVKLASR
jgi:hypothetical protein